MAKLVYPEHFPLEAKKSHRVEAKAALLAAIERKLGPRPRVSPTRVARALRRTRVDGVIPYARAEQIASRQWEAKALGLIDCAEILVAPDLSANGWDFAVQFSGAIEFEMSSETFASKNVSA